MSPPLPIGDGELFRQPPVYGGVCFPHRLMEHMPHGAKWTGLVAKRNGQDRSLQDLAWDAVVASLGLVVLQQAPFTCKGGRHFGTSISTQWLQHRAGHLLRLGPRRGPGGL